MKPIYLDYHATTPVDPRVLEAMLPYFKEHFGNASSKQHAYGWEADRGVELARKNIAQLINATPQEIIFTSGGTESDNLALLGVFRTYKSEGCHFITTQTEHKAILKTLKFIESEGGEVTYLPVDSKGCVKPEQIQNAIRPHTRLITVIHANNEIGAINPIEDIGRLAKEHDILFHSDGVQAIGRIPVDVQKLELDLLSISAHKIYGPKGVGALYIRKRQPRIRLTPHMMGGGQEKDIRSGTLNVPGIVGLGRACEILHHEMNIEVPHIEKLRNQMLTAFSQVEGLRINGDLNNRLCNNISVTVQNIPAHRIISTLPELAISTGSACSTQSVEPSYVLKAIGLSDEDAVSTIRFGLGRFTTENEVKLAIEIFKNGIQKLRKNLLNIEVQA